MHRSTRTYGTMAPVPEDQAPHSPAALRARNESGMSEQEGYFDMDNFDDGDDDDDDAASLIQSKHLRLLLACLLSLRFLIHFFDVLIKFRTDVSSVITPWYLSHLWSPSSLSLHS